MDFQNIIGQAHAKEILYKTLQHGRIPHAYLFCGPEGAGKLALGIILSKALFCQSPEKIICNQCSNCNKIESFNHPDLVIIFPALKSISVDEERKILQSIKEEPYFRYNPWANPTISIDKIRQIRKQSNLKPLSKYRVIIVNEAEKMTIEAANSLLKILEEPPSFTYFILTTSKPSALLPTIRSRCHQLDLTFLSDQEIESALVEREGVSPEQAKLISRISQVDVIKQ
jgi:DNA polymerase-3 subunit delta'